MKVNYAVVTKPSALVEEGAVLSWSGKGRLVVEAIETTSKGKFVVQMKRAY